MAPESNDNIDPTRNTLLKDVSVQGNNLVIQIKWAKNLQTGAEQVKLSRTNEPAFCPVAVWTNYTTKYLPVGIDASLPLLMTVEGNILRVLDKKALREQHKAIWQALQLQDQHYTPHSLRRGGATFYAEQGLPLEDIKKLGLWHSDAITFYLKKLNFTKTQLYTFITKL